MAKQPLGNIFDLFSGASFLDDAKGANSAFKRIDEWQAAAEGECPDARKCSTRQELARWFQLAGIAAGAIARSGDA